MDPLSPFYLMKPVGNAETRIKTDVSVSGDSSSVDDSPHSGSVNTAEGAQKSTSGAGCKKLAT